MACAGMDSPVNGNMVTIPGGDYKLWPLWIWIFCIVWWIVQDVVKVAAYWIMRRCAAQAPKP
jgi:hypothetical protein